MIGLYNLEPQYTNIALEKIRMYYGEEAENYMPLMHGKYERVYASSIFNFTDKSYVKDEMICGGTGFDLTTKLPPEIEAMKPKINMGFTTRGCIRRCPFCVVPEKEGDVVEIVGDITDFWDRKSRQVILLDNNILAVPNHFKEISRQLRVLDLAVDFNQGLDARLLNEETCILLNDLKYSEYYKLRFAWDRIDDEKAVIRGLKCITKYFLPRYICVYILIGYDTTEEEDLHRVRILRELKVDPYAMQYEKSEYTKRFARWVNAREIFKSVEWQEYRCRRTQYS